MSLGTKFEEVFGKAFTETKPEAKPAASEAQAPAVQTHLEEAAAAPAAPALPVSEPELSAHTDGSHKDEDLEKFLAQSMPKIFVVGSGGSGCNTINRMGEVGITGATLIAMNTDAQHLIRTRAEKKLLLGKKRTRGLGAGSNPEIGEAAAQESHEEIKNVLKGADMVFITCGMGGGTGTGSSHIIAKAAKELNCLVVGVVTAPFSSEGGKKMRAAEEGIEKLKKEADTTIVIPNDRLLYHVPDLPLNAAFKASDLVLTNAVKGITELITKPGLVNLDFADVVTVLSRSGTAMIGLGESGPAENKDRVMRAAEAALSSPLLDLDVSEANKALVSVTGGNDMTLGEVEGAVNSISQRIHPESMVKWGATLDDGMSGKNVRVLAVLAGIKNARPASTKAKEELELETI